MKNRALFTVVIAILLSDSNAACAQAPVIQWQKSYGGTLTDGINSLKRTPDGGYITASYSNSNNGDITAGHGSDDYWIVKTDSAGNIQWQRSYGGSDIDYPVSVTCTKDGGYIVGGHTSSTDGDVSTIQQGTGDAWIIKLDNAGMLQWQTMLGGTKWDFANDIDTASGGGYLVTGGTFSNDGDFSSTNSIANAWAAKLTSTGSVEWLETYFGVASCYAFDVERVSAGGYILAASVNAGQTDCILIRINDTGKVIWQNVYGGPGFEQALAVKETPGGGFIFGGSTNSTAGQVSNNHGGYDVWLVKVSDSGKVVWKKTYGGSSDESFGNISLAVNGGYVFSGNTKSNNGDVSGNHGGKDIWVVRIDNDGDIIWQKTLGGSLDEESFGVVQNPDGSFAIPGVTSSSNGDVTASKGSSDSWLVKLMRDATDVDDILVGLNAVKVYPTVNSGIFLIDIPSSLSLTDIYIFDAGGKKIAYSVNKKPGLYEIEIANAAPGMYWLRLNACGVASTYPITIR